MEAVPHDEPIACSLNQDDLAGRQQRWNALADRALIDVTRTDYGLRMRFRDEPGVEPELHDLAALERSCCAFADWTVGTDDNAIAFDVRGTSPDAVPVVHQMFTELRAAGATSG